MKGNNIPKSKYKLNGQITAPKVLVISEDGKENLGILDTAEALSIAKERELDLIEINPKNDPPVCRIADWSKLQYITQKKAKKAKVKGKQKTLKEMRFPVHIDVGDIAHKVRRIREFLSKGHKVKITIFVKGRPMPGQDKILLDNILTELENECKIEQPPKREGRNLSVFVMPIQVKKDAKIKDA
ncbi:translation initiation factor IF-3 [Candidatus Dojkabacteria bacterium]|uniref:Translation initiation factor IF-3 n=1 Tax=Candidatus Dojkabacteria bacterium TaxID=2099670 RepID=A0A955RID9_9BACT|nr:translation initiation factor IF-3 [Candidatus Dojkabacteria bacterium]